MARSVSVSRPHHVFVLKLDSAIPGIDGFPPWGIWGFRLANGTTCHRLASNIGSYQGHRITYRCNGSAYFAYGTIVTTGQPWVILTGRGSSPQLHWKAIGTAFQ
jgi:hypothetical protein